MKPETGDPASAPRPVGRVESSALPPVGHATWKTILPVTFIILSLLALAILPLLIARRTGAMREEIERVAEPARNDANQIQLALSGELDSIIGFQVTEQPQYRDDYFRAVDTQARAAGRIGGLSASLGGDVAERLAVVQKTSRQWHASLAAREILTRHLPAEVFTTALFEHHPDYETALESASRLEQSVQDAIDDRLSSIRAAEQVNRNLTMLLTLSAFASTILVIRLGRQMRVLAIEATGRRRDAEREAHEAKQAVRARDEVLAIVSHDLRNPLNAISLSSSFLAAGGLTDEQLREQFEVLRLSAHRMNRLIEDLLDVARMEGGKALPIDPVTTAVVPLLDEAVDLFKLPAGARKLSLETEVDGVTTVHADRDRVLQVLSNLVGNAMKFTPPGGTIRMAARRDGRAVRLSVADTGPGIPPEHQKDIFTAYWQAKRADRMGAGLGLPIAKGIVESHGGKIWVESQVGVGTTFYFTLPVGKEAV